MSESKHVAWSEAKQKQLDNVVRKLAQERKAAVEAELDGRKSYRDEGKVRWQAYQRFLLSDGHTVYVNLQTMEGSVSTKPDKYAQAKVEKREKANAKREARKAELAAKKAEQKQAKPEPKAKQPKVKKVKAEAKPKAENADTLAAIA